MSTPVRHENFIELSDHALIAARITTSEGRRSIAALREIVLQNRIETAEALRAIFPALADGTPLPATCALRPAQRILHRASRDEQKLHADQSAIEACVAGGLDGGSAAWSVAATSGAPEAAVPAEGARPWVAAAAPRASLEAALATLRELNIAPTRIESATLSFLGATHGMLTVEPAGAPILIWEPAATTSTLVLVGPGGVEGTCQVECGFENVFDALLAEIQLKFKGAAVRLFFNERYDFSESGPKIAARIAPAFWSAIDKLTATAGRAPGGFWCTGLPQRQSWFVHHLAETLHLSVWRPDVGVWCARSRLTFASDEVQRLVAPSNLGLLGAIAVRPADTVGEIPWHPVWIRPPSATTPVQPASAAVAQPSPAPESKPVPAAPAKPLKVAAPMSFAKAAVGGLEAVSSPAKVVPAPTASTKPVPPAARTKPMQVASLPGHDKSNSLVLRALSKGDDAPAETAAAAAPESTPPRVEKREPAPVEERKSKPAGASRKLAWLGGGLAGAAALAVGTIFFVRHVEAAKAEAAHERQLAQERAAAAQEEQRLAELRAQEAAEARRQAEERLAREKQAAAEAQRVAAETERARQAESERLLNARGSLEIKTNPAGATVQIGNLPPQTSPLQLGDLRLGNHPVRITLEGYDPVELQVEIEENVVTAPPLVSLARQTGTLVIAATPAPASYTVQPAGISFSLGRAKPFTGQTPATLTGLPTGDYDVTLERPGWPVVTKSVAVTDDATITVSENFPGGTVRIVSVPAGAEVLRDGVVIGRAPLTLTDVTPGSVTYQLTAPDYHPTTVQGSTASGQTTDLQAQLVPVEKIARFSELDVQPKPLRTVMPQLANGRQFAGQKVVISVVVDRDGTPHDWRVESTPDAALADECIEAIAQWTFEPGRIAGQPVKVRVTVPFVLTAN